MAILTFKPKYYSYEEWIEEFPDMAGEDQECEQCDGTGEDTCFSCGGDIPCEKCNGTGIVGSKKDAYSVQRERDEKMIKKYLASFGAG